MAWHEEVMKICAKEILIPFEGYHKKLSDGSCTSYPDPYSPLGRKQIKAEGLNSFELTKAGYPWTIGYGSTFDIDGTLVMPGLIWTHEKAVAVKTSVMNSFLQKLLAFSPMLIFQSPRRVAGILSWFYNLGAGAYRISTFKKKIDQESWEEAADECIKWNKAKVNGVLTVSKGLTKRRILEASYIRNG